MLPAEQEPNLEFFPAASSDTARQWEVIDGEGKHYFACSPEKLGVTKEIEPDLFASSRLMQTLQVGDIWITKWVAPNTYEPSIKPKTERTELIKEVLNVCLPPGSQEVIDQMTAEARLNEADFEQMLKERPERRLGWSHALERYADSLIVQGLEAFEEASWDFNNGLFTDYVRETLLFAAFLIENNPD